MSKAVICEVRSGRKTPCAWGSGAKLLDFGLAKMADPSDCGVTETAEGMVVGTAAYMSPEQAQGKAVDERSDVFSFGAVPYEMLAGRRAFAGGSMAEVRAALEQCLAKQPGLQPSIVVLPFANLSADRENESFSDGLAEEILNLLTKVPELKVIARTSSFAFGASSRTSGRSPKRWA